MAPPSENVTSGSPLGLRKPTSAHNAALQGLSAKALVSGNAENAATRLQAEPTYPKQNSESWLNGRLKVRSQGKPQHHWRQKKPNKPFLLSIFNFCHSNQYRILKGKPSISVQGGLEITAEATVRLRCSSEKQLTTLLDALSPEAEKPVGTRASAVLEREGHFLVLKVEAKDTVALRAALNAYLRWIGSTVNVLEVVEHAT
jgi:tRNA threonylcarbamoyladenosine modification (KEOPS) complex  Pcc1 subunit